MMRNALVVGSALTLLSVIDPTPNAQAPADTCALLQPAEIQALAGSAKVSAGKPGTDASGARTCRYEWGTGGNVSSGRSFLNVHITPASKGFAGTSLAVVRQGLLESAKAGAPNTGVIPGVGDAAIFDSTDPIRFSMTALAKGNMLLVELQTLKAKEKKDQMIALLKAAVGRL